MEFYLNVFNKYMFCSIYLVLKQFHGGSTAQYQQEKHFDQIT